MRLALVLRGFLIAVIVCLGFGNAQAADDDWLVGHWEGHDTKNANDKRHFVLDVAGVKSDQSFIAQWTVDAKASSGQGKIDGNGVTVAFKNGNNVSLFRASDGSLAGSTTPENGGPGIALVFVKGAASATAATPPAAAGSDKTCAYHQPVPKGQGPIMHANNGDVVVTREGQVKCVNGRMMPVN